MAIFPGYGFGAELVRSYPVVNGVTSIEEGLALTFKYPLEDGVAKVQVGSSSSGDQFAGVSYYQYRILPTKLNSVESGTVPASGSYTFTLAKTPAAASTEVRVVVTSPAGSATVLAYDGSTADGTHFIISGRTITVDSSFAGYTILVTYSYTPSATDARNFFGDVRPGLSNTSSIGIINVIQKGVIVTTSFDPASDWNSSAAIKVASTGYFTKSGSGLSVPNCIVKEAPSVGKPFLTLELR